MSSKKVIYFTDDDLDDLQVLTAVAESLGHSSYHFRNGGQLLSALTNTEALPDLIFLDICLPGEDGLAIISKLNSIDKLREVPVIIYSGNCVEKDVSKSFELGARYFIRKPYTYVSLLSALQYAMSTDWSSYKAAREDFLHKE